ncbi:hypothetical protein LTR08_000355 [Meristemomyces frigidus]|nr:hypothetical protein LTR08_000355 [Meristemomyces frigidus]
MANSPLVRKASHAASWYSASPPQLNAQLDGWLADVKTPVTCIGPLSAGQTVAELPVAGARVIIAPHAGYAYSGPAAAWAYKAWDVSKAKRVFLLGPSHHHYLTKAALTRCTHYATPLGNLPIDRATTADLHKTGHFDWMTPSVDEDEHSLEMHLPYIYKTLSKSVPSALHHPRPPPQPTSKLTATTTRTFGPDPTSPTFPPLIPLLIGNTTPATEKALALLLAPYLADPTSAFVISSDFAHWGTRFRYTYYRPHPPGPAQQQLTATPRAGARAIHESIREVDFECMGACEAGVHGGWCGVLEGA